MDDKTIIYILVAVIIAMVIYYETKLDSVRLERFGWAQFCYGAYIGLIEHNSQTLRDFSDDGRINVDAFLHWQNLEIENIQTTADRRQIPFSREFYDE